MNRLRLHWLLLGATQLFSVLLFAAGNNQKLYSAKNDSLLKKAITSPTIKNAAAPAMKDYLQKARNQHTAGWLLLGCGTTLTIIGLVVGGNDIEGAVEDFFSGTATRSGGSGEVIFYTGLVAMAGSIPLFIASSRNRKKAVAVLSIKFDNATLIRKVAYVNKTLPSLTLQIGF